MFVYLSIFRPKALDFNLDASYIEFTALSQKYIDINHALLTVVEDLQFFGFDVSLKRDKDKQI